LRTRAARPLEVDAFYRGAQALRLRARRRQARDGLQTLRALLRAAQTRRHRRRQKAAAAGVKEERLSAASIKIEKRNRLV